MSYFQLKVYSMEECDWVTEAQYKTVDEAVSAAVECFESGKYNDKCSAVIRREGNFSLMMLAYWDHECGSGIFVKDENGEFMNQFEGKYGTYVRAAWTPDGEELSETLAHLETCVDKDEEEEVSSGNFERAGTDVFDLVARMNQVMDRQIGLDRADDFWSRLCFGRSIVS